MGSARPAGPTTVAVAQTRVDIDDRRGTVERALTAVRGAAAAGAHVVVLPELCTTGWAYASADEAMASAEPADGPTVGRIAALSAELGLVVVFGFAERAPAGRPYDSAMVVDHGVRRAVYRKTHLWDRENLVFARGDRRPPVVETSAGRVGVLVCYDLEFPELARDLALRGAQLIAAPVNWPVVPKPDGERPIEVAKAQAAAAVNKVFVAVADRCGAERGVDWFGSSVICDLHGFPVAGPAAGGPGMLTADLDLAAADDKRLGPHNDAFDDRRLDLAPADSEG